MIEFKKAMSCLPSAVTIITTMGHNDLKAGVTISSFSSLSLTPPLVMFALGKHSHNLKCFEHNDYFVVHILGAEQFTLSNQFAKATGDKWAGIEVLYSEVTRCPIIQGVSVVIECQKYQSYEGGDHVIFIGEVIKTHISSEDKPLIYYKSSYRHIS